MAVISPKDGDFRHPGLSYLDFKQVDMDRVLTAFLARLNHDGKPSRLRRGSNLDVDFFVDLIRSGAGSPGGRPRFRGFDTEPDVTRRWVETDLVDMVSRGKAGQAVAGLRPLHGLTYQFRNSRQSRPYGADEHLYEMLAGAPSEQGIRALARLKGFFFTKPGTAAEPGTGRLIDVETQALLHLSDKMATQVEDATDKSKPRRQYPPFCPSQADLLADDVLRLIAYERFVPRSVMVEYLKILFAFHLALYHLRVIKALPAVIERGSTAHECELDPHPAGPAEMGVRCAFDIGLFVDAAAAYGSPAARLAARSAEVWQRRIPGYVRASYTVKKLDDFAGHLLRKGYLASPPNRVFPIDTVLGLRAKKYRNEFDMFFGQRLAALLETAADGNGADGGLPGEAAQIMSLRMDDFTSYIELLVRYRGVFHRKYLNECLDTLMLKGKPGALVAQKQHTKRWFVLDSRLIEVLLQLALVRKDERGLLHTAPLRVDEFLTVLRTRYGLYVDRLPAADDGFGQSSIEDHKALRANVDAFTERLREIGFYTDLSDAYLTQTIRPRYTI